MKLEYSDFWHASSDYVSVNVTGDKQEIAKTQIKYTGRVLDEVLEDLEEVDNSKQLYKYNADMTFDFVNNLPDACSDDSRQETACDTENAIQEYFEKMGKYDIYFRLLEGTTPVGTFPFEVIGTQADLLRWNKESWLDDDKDFEDSLVLVK